MRVGNYDIKAPLILGGDENEAEVLGATVWLWMHSEMHRDAPLHTLPTLLLPIIKRQQYVLVVEQAKPVLFFSWAWLNLDAEKRYLTTSSIHMKDSDWTSGDRIWICDWIAPFGHTRAMSQLLRSSIFPDHCGRALYHKGTKRGIRVLNFHGVQVSAEQARAWRRTHPLAVDLPEFL